jgi:3-keto-5-aminohexanoate cleavage enzyme
VSGTWIEVALNGPWGTAIQPGIPISHDAIVREAIACANAGASIVHFHAYDEDTGRQNDDWQSYARTIAAIRDAVDVIAYPTVPLVGSGVDRYRHIDELGRRGLIEWAVVDPGSVNFVARTGDGTIDPGFVYMNPPDHVREGLHVCRDYGIRPSYAIYEPGFTRLGAELAAEYPGLPRPVYRFMFTDQFAWGFPPEPYALEAHLRLLGACDAAASWMIAGLGVDVEPLAAEAIARGGHVRVGLEDARFGTERTNVELVEAAARLVERAGSRPASAAEVRAAAAGGELQPDPFADPSHRHG